MRRKLMFTCVFLLIAPMLIFSFLANTSNAISPHKDNPFQQEGSKSKPFKVIINLEYTDKQYREGVGKILVYYEDGDGFKKKKFYDFDEMMKRAWPNHVKVKAKFPRNTASHFEDYLICVKNLMDGKNNCVNDSRSPGVEKERVHLKVP